jgi:hypothetical protein
VEARRRSHQRRPAEIRQVRAAAEATVILNNEKDLYGEPLDFRF